MRQHQTRWRILILMLVACSTLIAVVFYLVLGIMDFGGALRALPKVFLIGFLTWGFWELFRRRLWRWRVFRGWLVDIPDLNGEWLGVAHSSYDSSARGESSQPLQVLVSITQTFTSLSVAFQVLTLTSDSHSVAASLVTDPPAKRSRLVYTYLNEPVARANDLDMHFGTAILEIHGEPASKMVGFYMTGRKDQTKGKLELTRKMT